MNDDLGKAMSEIMQSAFQTGVKSAVAQAIYTGYITRDADRLKASPDELTGVAQNAWRAAEVFAQVAKKNTSEYGDSIEQLFKDMGLDGNGNPPPEF